MSHNGHSATLYAVWRANPASICSTKSVGNTFTLAGIEYIKLADGNCWTHYSQGTAIWQEASSLCPVGTTLPNAAQFDTLISHYDGVADTRSYGAPYGYYSTTTALRNATGWSGGYWSSTNNYYDNYMYPWLLIVQPNDSYSYVGFGSGPDGALQVVCIVS